MIYNNINMPHSNSHSAIYAFVLSYRTYMIPMKFKFVLLRQALRLTFSVFFLLSSDATVPCQARRGENSSWCLRGWRCQVHYSAAVRTWQCVVGRGAGICCGIMFFTCPQRYSWFRGLGTGKCIISRQAIFKSGMYMQNVFIGSCKAKLSKTNELVDILVHSPALFHEW